MFFEWIIEQALSESANFIVAVQAYTLRPLRIACIVYSILTTDASFLATDASILATEFLMSVIEAFWVVAVAWSWVLQFSKLFLISFKNPCHSSPSWALFAFLLITI